LEVKLAELSPNYLLVCKRLFKEEENNLFSMLMAKKKKGFKLQLKEFYVRLQENPCYPYSSKEEG